LFVFGVIRFFTVECLDERDNQISSAAPLYNFVPCTRGVSGRRRMGKMNIQMIN
jgi:hypothetical protein